MKILSKASSSKGNLHLLQGINEYLMLDCGVSNIRFASGYNVVGVLLSHSHSDHIKGLKGKCFLGNRKVYGSKHTLDKCDALMTFQKVEIVPNKDYYVGNEFIIRAFELPHDDYNFGYLIYHKYTQKKIVYITDCGSLDNVSFSDIDTYIIECNYDENYYRDLDYQAGLRVLSPEEVSALNKFKRLSSGEGHLSMQQLIAFLKRDMTKRTNNVILIHISNDIGDYEKIAKKVAKEIRKSVNVVAINPNLAPSEMQLTELKE